MKKLVILLAVLFSVVSFASDPPRTKLTGVEVERSLVPPACTREYQSKKAGEICRDASTGVLKRWNGSSWVEVSGSSDSLRGDPITVDSDDDGTPEYCIISWGERCRGTDCNSDGIADQTPVTGVDTDCDGTADFLYSVNGVSTLGGRHLIEPKGIVVLTADCHGEDFEDYAALCDQYDIPCTFPTAWGDPSKSTPGSALMQQWSVHSEVTVEEHTARHAWNGYPTSDFDPEYNAEDMNGYTSDGSATCTNGSAVVTGSGTDWGVTDYAVKHAWFVCDWDNDGDIDATDRQHACKIASVDSTTQLTLDCDYDGTTTTTGEYEIKASYAFGIYETERGVEAIQEVLGSNYRLGYHADPGSWDVSDDQSIVSKAFTGVPVGAAQKTATNLGIAREYLGHRKGGESIGNLTEPSRMSWIVTSCRTTGDFFDAVLESAYKDRSIIIINTHELRDDSYCSSNPSEGAISESALRHLLQKLGEYRAAGKLLVVNAASLASYVRMMGPGAQYEWNLFRNAHFVEASSGNSTDGGAAIFGWIESDSDGTAAHVQKDGFTISGDGDGILTFENSGAAATTDIKQWFRLDSGFYVGSIEIDAREATAGTVYIKFIDSFTDTDDATMAMPVLWHEEPGGSTYIRESTYTVPAGQVRSITWHFWTPDRLNQPIAFYLKLSSVTGTVKVAYPSMVRRAPIYMDAKYSGGSGLPNVSVSFFDPGINVLSGLPDAAFARVWTPNEKARVDTPGNKLRSESYLDASGARQEVEWVDISAKGVGDHHVTGTYNGSGLNIDVDGDSTNELTVDNEGVRWKPWEQVEHYYDCAVPVEASRAIPSSYCPRNGGSCTTISVIDTTANGVCKMGTGSVAGNDVSLWGYSAYGPTDIGTMSLSRERDFRVRLRTLNTGGTGYYMVAGGIKTSTSWDFSTITDGAYFWCDPATDNTWHAITMSGSTSTDTDTSQDCNGADSNYHELRIVYESSGPTVKFYIDGSEVASHTTNLPADGAISAWLLGLETTDATADYAYADWIYYRGVR